MENQTRFDLNAALESWRAELAAQPGLSADERRELETHLRDTLTELKSRGLSEEESFWLARRRIGQVQKLAEEFVKADPTQVWRDRVFWMSVALLAYSSWSILIANITVLATNAISNWIASGTHGGSDYWFGLSPIFSGLFMTTMRLLPFCWLVVLLLRGNVDPNSRLVSIFRSRINFVLIPATVIGFHCWRLINSWYERKNHLHNLPPGTVHLSPIWLSGFSRHKNEQSKSPNKLWKIKPALI